MESSQTPDASDLSLYDNRTAKLPLLLLGGGRGGQPHVVHHHPL
jgi:hypothetical protein